MLMVELAVNPVDKGVHLGDFTRKAVEFIAHSGLDYRVGPMGTTIEGELSEVMAVVAECLTLLAANSERFVFTLQGDLRREPKSQMHHNIESVKTVLVSASAEELEQ